MIYGFFVWSHQKFPGSSIREGTKHKWVKMPFKKHDKFLCRKRRKWPLKNIYSFHQLLINRFCGNNFVSNCFVVQHSHRWLSRIDWFNKWRKPLLQITPFMSVIPSDKQNCCLKIWCNFPVNVIYNQAETEIKCCQGGLLAGVGCPVMAESRCMKRVS